MMGIGSSPFDSPRLLIADAHDDIHLLNGMVKGFLQKIAYPPVSYFDLEKRVLCPYHPVH
jgi:hypothetical protein